MSIQYLPFPAIGLLPDDPESFYRYLRWIGKTTRSSAQQVAKEMPKRSIVTFWHSDLLLLVAVAEPVFQEHKVMALVERGPIGESARYLVRRLGGIPIDVGSINTTRQAIRFIKQQFSNDADGVLSFAADGPSGPRFHDYGARERFSRLLEVPSYHVFVSASRKYHLNTWDKACVPKAFGNIRIRLIPSMPQMQNGVAWE